MVLRDSNGRDGWQTETNSIVSMGFDGLPAQAPQHPIPTMQGAFEESMIETLQETDNIAKEYAKADSLGRRRMLLEKESYERTVAGRWKQKAGENFHPLWKLVAQISFGMHLLHQGLAKSDEEVIKILQTHVDEIDGFLERTTEDLELAQRDINERIRYLKLPLEHGDVFDNMLMDRKFRNAILDGNEKIEHIVDRTSIALRDTLKDVRKGFDGTRELARYFRKLEKTWENQTEEHMGVYAAMMGNTEGWTSAYVDLQNKGNVLHDSLTELSSIIAEIQRRVGIASRKNIPSNASSRANTQPPSRVASVYSVNTPQSPGQKPHITSAIGTGMRRHGSTSNSIGGTQDGRPFTSSSSHRAQPSSSSVAVESTKSRGHSRRGSDESNSRRVSFNEYSQQTVIEPLNSRGGSTNKRNSKDRGFGTSWFRKSIEQNMNKEKKRKSTSSLKEEPTVAPEGEDVLRSPSVRTAPQPVAPKESPPPPLQAEIAPPVSTTPPAPPRMSESIGIQNHLKNRESMSDQMLQEVIEEEGESEPEPEVEIVQASQIQSKSRDNLAREVTIPAPSSPTAQKPVASDLPLREVQPYERVSDTPPRVDLDNGPSLTESVTGLKRSSTHEPEPDPKVESSPATPTETRPGILEVQRVSSFDPFQREAKKEELQKSPETPKTKTPTRRPANLKLFPTIPVSPGPSTAPLTTSKPLYSPVQMPRPSSGRFDTKGAGASGGEAEGTTDLKEKVGKEEPPRTPAERGRSPPPPERVPTPILQAREVSPSLRALTSATVSGPEPDFPFGGFGEVPEEEAPAAPMPAELGPGRRTADGSRSASPEHAELGADSPAARHTPQAVNPPFHDPEARREQLEAQKRERELRNEEEKKKVQEQIMSRVVQKASMDLSDRGVNGPAGDPNRLYLQPQVNTTSPPGHYVASPVMTAHASNAQHLHPKSVPLEQASPSTPLPYSKHNRHAGKDLKSLLKRFLRIGRSKEKERKSVPPYVAATAEYHHAPPPPMQRRGFSLSLPFNLNHRRKRSQDQRINTQGGLQPFGVWRNTAQGMSWGDTRRGSFTGHQQYPPMQTNSGLDTDTDEGSPDGRGRGGSERPAGEGATVQGVVPRPQEGTMYIPGVGTADWNRASTYTRHQQQNNIAMQNLLKEHAGTGPAEDSNYVPPVPPVPATEQVMPAEDEEDDEEEEEDELRYESTSEETEQLEDVPEEDQAQSNKPGPRPQALNEDEDEVEESSESGPNIETPTKSQTTEEPPRTDDGSEPGARYVEESEDTSRHPSPKSESSHSHHSEHSEHSQHSQGTAGRSSLAASSVLARKSDATPTTGLSLHFNSVHGENKDQPEGTNAAQTLARAGSTASARDGTAAAALSPSEDTFRTSLPNRSVSATNPAAASTAAGAATMAARSPALGGDRIADPMDRAGSQLPQRDSVKSHERESLGVIESPTSPTSFKESPSARKSSSSNPPRSSSLGQTMLQEGSSSEEEDEAEPATTEPKAQESPVEEVIPAADETDPLAQRESVAPVRDIADSDTKPALVVVGAELEESETPIQVEEVIRDRTQGNGTPF